jgi:cell division protein FtsW (lipid II flippase)
MSSAATSPATAPRQSRFHRFWRALRQLFLEVIGAVFAVLALVWLNLALRSWSRDVAHWLIATAVAVALLFVFFAITSFRRARRL